MGFLCSVGEPTAAEIGEFKKRLAADLQGGSRTEFGKIVATYFEKKFAGDPALKKLIEEYRTPPPPVASATAGGRSGR